MTSATGVFTMTVPSGSYTVSVSKDGYLPATRTGVEVQPRQIVNLPDLTLLSGDVNRDGLVDVYDLAVVGMNFNKVRSPWPQE